MAALTDVARLAVRLDLPLDTYTAYEAQAHRLQRRVEDLMAEQLARYQYLPPDERPLVLTSGEREQLEALLGPVTTGASVLARIRAATETSLQGVKLHLEKWQLEEIKRRAEKNGTTLKEELEQAVKAVTGLAFHGMGGV